MSGETVMCYGLAFMAVCFGIMVLAAAYDIARGSK